MKKPRAGKPTTQDLTEEQVNEEQRTLSCQHTVLKCCNSEAKYLSPMVHLHTTIVSFKPKPLEAVLLAFTEVQQYIIVVHPKTLQATAQHL